jgi:hypothetical protein
MNAAIDTGHTWLEFEGPDSKWTFSFGPKKPVSPGDLLLRDGVPSKNNYPFTSHVKTAVSMEWLISKVQFDNAKILAGKFNMNYSKHITCTSTALSLLNRINVNPAPPTGLGPVIVRSFGITAYSNKSASNPYNLSKEISK